MVAIDRLENSQPLDNSPCPPLRVTRMPSGPADSGQDGYATKVIIHPCYETPYSYPLSLRDLDVVQATQYGKESSRK